MWFGSKMIMVEGMPKYAYHCNTCEEDFQAFHLMCEKLEKRSGCDKDCSLKKVPSFPINLNKVNKKQKVGEIVKQHIENAKEDIEEDRKKLREEEYKP